MSSENDPNQSQIEKIRAETFKGIIVTFTGISMDLRHELAKLIEEMGGVCSSSLDENVTHLIAETCDNKSDKYVCARRQRMPVLLPTWIYEARKNQDSAILSNINSEEILDLYRTPIFAGCEITISGFSGTERIDIGRLVEMHGGVFSGQMSKHSCTHLITTSNTGEKYHRAKEWGSVYVVSEKWLRKSIELKARLPESKFSVGEQLHEEKTYEESAISIEKHIKVKRIIEEEDDMDGDDVQQQIATNEQIQQETEGGNSSHANKTSTETAKENNNYANKTSTETAKENNNYANKMSTETAKENNNYANKTSTETAKENNNYANKMSTETAKENNNYANKMSTETAKENSNYANKMSTETAKENNNYANKTSTETEGGNSSHANKMLTETEGGNSSHANKMLTETEGGNSSHANKMLTTSVSSKNPTASRKSEFEKSSEEWKSSTKKETYALLEHELGRLLATATPNKIEYWRKEFENFKSLFARFLRAKTTINWKKIQPLPEGSIIPYSQLDMINQQRGGGIKELMDSLVVVKLNGGLGTSMGCKGPKSAISVRNDLTFLDLTLQQIQSLNREYGVSVPLLLMNSFNTDENTQKLLKKYTNVRVEVQSFAQSRYPRVNRESYMPIARNLEDNDMECWYPPGHGNFYDSFLNSGLLDKFIKQGKKYVFLSNIDNLGATVDPNILNYMAKRKAEFIMEVTDKTRADVKGGTLIEYEERLMLLEIAQVPPDYVDEFKSVSKFRIFNTNNLWASLEAIKRVVEAGELNMEVIVNPKHLDRGVDVIQLETAAGAAIKCFKGACGINVPRSRFLPVKKTSDLLLLMSNLYDIENGYVTLSSLRSFPTTPLVKLGNSFDQVKEFLKRFQGIPNLLELDHLTVSGDVWFGRDVTLKGTMIIIANQGDRIDIPAGTILENKIVSGNLRILDH